MSEQQTTTADDPQARIAELEQQLAAAQTQPAAPAPADAPVDLSGAKPGQVVHYRIESNNGDDPVYGYGLVLEVITVHADTLGEPVDGEPTATELRVAELTARGNRLTADQVLEIG